MIPIRRGVPLRIDQEISCFTERLTVKTLIEEDPPLFLYEDKRIEAQQPQVGNNQASESPESAGYA